MYRSILLIAFIAISQSHALYKGKEIEIEDAAYQVRIRERSHLKCGGSILRKEWVLTAASCVNAFLENLEVHAGSEDPKAGSVHEIVEVYHASGDFALLRVTPPFDFDSTRQPIRLVDSDYKLQAGEKLLVSGYGYTDGFVPSPKLRSIDTRSMLLEDCVKRYASLSGIFPGMMCTDGSEFGTSSCSYDAGNPVILDDGRLVAVTTSKHSCGEEDQPDIHVLVAKAKKWIEIIMNAQH